MTGCVTDVNSVLGLDVEMGSVGFVLKDVVLDAVVGAVVVVPPEVVVVVVPVPMVNGFVVAAFDTLVRVGLSTQRATRTKALLLGAISDLILPLSSEQVSPSKRCALHAPPAPRLSSFRNAV